jgi:AraC family transcriptional regulator of adaptative response/methylated-DNA-[protein]-cysteine methyltransferase
MNSTTLHSQSPLSIPPHLADQFWRATVARDSGADGLFFLGVRSTGIYCRPSCPARRPLRTNVIFYRTQQEAEREGFRPCLRCRPNHISDATRLVQQAAELLRESREESVRLSAVARELGATTGTLRRAFQRVTGLKPRELAEALRLAKFKKLLRSGSSITDALYETGYGSSSRVYERSNAQLGMTPATYQKGGEGMKIGYTIAESGLGKVLVGATSRGVSAVYLGDSSSRLVSELRQEYPRAEIRPAHAGFGRWVGEILRRTEGEAPAHELPLDLRATAFQRRVWQELQRIPRGSTRTYGEIARALGQPRAVRAVARACATNPVSVVVPCHRVVRSDGNLAGYRWGLSRKQKLLSIEKSA